MLPKKGDDTLVITKSLKDVMTLYEYGITAIAPCSENLFVTDAQYDKLKKKYKHIYLFYDQDVPGIKAMCKIKKQYPDLRILFLPRHGTDKDISDYRKAHGDKKTLELINKVKSYYGERDKEET
jgi:DNA primase